MIRRITRNNDYKDIIKSCPVGVIDYVYRVDYYVSGHPEVFVEMTPVKVGEHLEVVISTEALENLTYNGVLMRRAYYSQADSEYPDDSYDLEFVDNMNVWLGEEDTAAPFDPGYLTEDDLKTINGESIVGEGNIEISVPDYYATKSWVSDQGYLTSVALSGYATKSWVSDQGYLTSVPSGYATESWVSSQGYLTEVPSEYATESFVMSEGEYLYSQVMTDVRIMLDPYAKTNDIITYISNQDFASKTWVSSNFLSTTALTGYATESWVSSQIETASDLVRYVTFSEANWSAIDFSSGYVYMNTKYTSSTYQGVLYSWGKLYDVTYTENSGYEENPYLTGNTLGNYLPVYDVATQSWVSAQGYLTSETIPSDIATQSWVSSNFLSTTALTGYATESWVQSQGYLISVPSEYATQSWTNEQIWATESYLKTWVSSYLVSNSYATESWVQSQGYLTAVPAGYATESWVSSNFLSSTALTGYATESWVTSQSYITSTALTGYATESWVSSNFLSSTALSGYATESWVSSQGYLTSVPSEYATQSWVSSQFLETSKIWTGTSSQWAQLTSEQQAFYTIALVTE